MAGGAAHGPPSRQDLGRCVHAILAGAAAAGLLGLWWYWRVLLPAENVDLTILNYDLYAEVAPRVEFAFSALRQGRIPLWNPYQLSGTPFLATQQHGALYPLNAAHLVLPLPLALSVTAVLHYWIAAVSAALLARDLGASRLGAAVAGAAFALSGAMFQRLYLPPHLYAACWLPAQLLLARRLHSRGVTPARVIALAAVFALQLLGGYAQYSLFAIYLLSAWILWVAVSGPSLAKAAGTAAAVIAAGLLAMLLSAAQLLPSIELLVESPRRPGLLLDANLRGTALLSVLRSLLLPAAWPGIATEASFGIVLLFLALLGVSGESFSRRDRGFFALVIVLALPLVQGATGPLFPAVRLLPGYEWFREPNRILVVVVLLLSCLGASGMSRIAASTSRLELARRLAMPLLLFAGLAVLLGQLDPAPHPLGSWHRFLWLGAALGLALLLPHGRWRAPAVAVLALAELLLLHSNPVVLPHTDPHAFDPSPAAIDYLRHHQGYGRTLIAEGLHRAFEFEPQPLPKTGMAAGLYALGDYENLYSARYASFLGALQGREPLPPAWQGRVFGNALTIRRRLLDVAGCAFVLASPPQPFVRPGGSAYPLLHRDERASVLANPTALPRAYLVHRAVGVDSVEEALGRLRDPSFPHREAVTLEGLSAATVELPAIEGTIAIETYEPERVVLRAVTDGEAFAFLSDQDYPGWSAYLDGAPVDVLRANGVFRAVRVPPGEHRIEFLYTPRSFRLGALASVLSLAATGVLLVYSSRRRRRDEDRRPFPPTGR
jgi:hypothetical protein